MKNFTVAITLLVGCIGCATQGPYDFAQWQGRCRGYEDTKLHQECMEDVNKAIQNDLRARKVSTYESSFFDSKEYYQSLKDQQTPPGRNEISTSTCRTAEGVFGDDTTECLTNY